MVSSRAMLSAWGWGPLGSAGLHLSPGPVPWTPPRKCWLLVFAGLVLGEDPQTRIPKPQDSLWPQLTFPSCKEPVTFKGSVLQDTSILIFQGVQ